MTAILDLQPEPDRRSARGGPGHGLSHTAVRRGIGLLGAWELKVAVRALSVSLSGLRDGHDTSPAALSGRAFFAAAEQNFPSFRKRVGVRSAPSSQSPHLRE